MPLVGLQLANSEAVQSQERILVGLQTVRGRRRATTFACRPGWWALLLGAQSTPCAGTRWHWLSEC
jgi:hypothetical protein